MSVLKISKYGWFISHDELIKEIYKNVDNSYNFQLKSDLFKIVSPFKTRKNVKLISVGDFTREVRHVLELFRLFNEEIKIEEFFKENCEVRNTQALDAALQIYTKSRQNMITNIYGGNPNEATIKLIENERFLFPQNCIFYGKDVSEFSQHLKDEKFDLILLDPPWWNKYIRRKRKHSNDGYDMLYNEELKKLPLEHNLNDNGLVVVWCTNSSQHLTELCNEILPKWGVSFVGKWYWVKVTQSGETICPFSPPPRKQPFEQIIIGCKKSRGLPMPPCDKLVVSVPSALHSHKPPLIKLFEPFLPTSPRCLEIFARYLLPNWTSYGREVLRLQNECLYERINE